MDPNERDPGEWRAGRIPGARWIPMAELPNQLDELATNRPVVTVCRSAKMAEFLTSRGYCADNLDRGMPAKAGLPVQTPGDERPGTVA
jgi:rhodanese-related sulfurtransferase